MMLGAKLNAGAPMSPISHLTGPSFRSPPLCGPRRRHTQPHTHAPVRTERPLLKTCLALEPPHSPQSTESEAESMEVYPVSTKPSGDVPDPAPALPKWRGFY